MIQAPFIQKWVTEHMREPLYTGMWDSSSYLLKNKSLIPCISCSKILICTLNVFSKSANTAVLTTDFTTSSLWKRQNCFCVYEVNLENNIRRPFMGFSFQTQSSNMFVCAVSGYLRKWTPRDLVLSVSVLNCHLISVAPLWGWEVWEVYRVVVVLKVWCRLSVFNYHLSGANLDWKCFTLRALSISLVLICYYCIDLRW